MNLPHISTQKINALKQWGIEHLVQLLEKKDIRDVLKRIGMDKDEALEAYKALERVPLVDMKWTIVPIDERNEPLENELLEEGGEAQMIVSLRRVNACNNKSVLMNNFPKPKECGWFLVVANPDTEEVICLKRVTLNRLTQKNLIVMLPDDFETPLQVILMSDSYIGLDQSYTVDLNKVNNKLRLSMKEPVKKPKKVVAQIDDSKKDDDYAGPSLDNKQEYEEAGNSSDDGFCKYN